MKVAGSLSIRHVSLPCDSELDKLLTKWRKGWMDGALRLIDCWTSIYPSIFYFLFGDSSPDLPPHPFPTCPALLAGLRGKSKPAERYNLSSVSRVHRLFSPPSWTFLKHLTPSRYPAVTYSPYEEGCSFPMLLTAVSFFWSPFTTREQRWGLGSLALLWGNCIFRKLFFSLMNLCENTRWH